MGPTKRSNEGQSVSPKKKSFEGSKIEIETSDSDCVPCSSSEELRLTSLPNEILLLIFSYLSPVDILSLSRLNDERLTQVSHMINEANFSSCRNDNVEIVTLFFTRIRVTYVQKLNFNYYCYLTPSEMVNLICRCKNLTALSVVECGLSYTNIVSILESCTKLEKLAWSITNDSVPHSKSLSLFYPNMKQVCLFSSKQDVPSYDLLTEFLFMRNVWFNTANDFLSALPFIALWSRSFFACNPLLTIHFTFSSSSSFKTNLEYVLKPQQILVLCSDDSQNQSDPVSNRVYDCPPVLQIRSKSEDISSLSSSPLNVYSTLTILLCPDFVDVSESLAKCVEEIAGIQLKHFSLQHEPLHLSTTNPLEELTTEESLIVCEFLEKVFLTSKNITVLNLVTVHFCAGSPVKAITQLASLKTLSIPSCAFGKSCTSVNSEFVSLSDIVSNCPKIEDFVLYCCVYADPQITEEDVRCVKNWSLLKHLSIYHTVFRSYNFLQKVTDSCEDLLSFSLIASAPNKICCYTNDVIYLLKKAKKLRFIRINDRKFYPMEKRFWNAIGEAANLEGICIMTQLASYIEKKTVLQEIKKLKYLQLFHLYSPKVSENLIHEVRQSMRKHGIKVTRVDQCCDIAAPDITEDQKKCHKQPDFSCENLHFKDIDIF